MSKEETILAVLRDDFYKGLPNQADHGLILRTNLILNHTNTIWIPRQSAEYPNNTIGMLFRHIIPYGVLKYVKNGELHIGSYVRTKKGNEVRLHDNWSIGVGGHVSTADIVHSDNGTVNIWNTLRSNLQREIQEELGLDVTAETPYSTRMIYDDRDSVGLAHIGLLYEYYLPEHVVVGATESHVAEFEFRTVEEIRSKKLESWSEIALEHVIKNTNLDDMREYIV